MATVNCARSRYDIASKYDISAEYRFCNPKCDESKPSCKKCESYHTHCNYNSTSPILEPLAHGHSNLHDLQTQQIFENRISICVANSAPGISPSNSFQAVYPLSAQDSDLLYKFHARTVMTLGRGNSNAIYVYKNAFAKLAFSVCFLCMWIK